MSSNLKTLKLTFELETITISKGRKITQKATGLIDYEQKKTILNVTMPQNIIYIEEKGGNQMLFDPKRNELLKTKSTLSLLRENVVYQFIQNKESLGLEDRGFVVKEIKNEDGLLVKLWTPPLELSNQISTIKTVSKDGIIIFKSEIDIKNRVSEKIFYTDFKNNDGHSLPMKITKFNYEFDPKKGKIIDSVVTIQKYSNIAINQNLNTQLLYYELPKDVKVILE
ncbi:MAG: hypothetical protein SNJ77_05450 [Cytophagales bacterium]